MLASKLSLLSVCSPLFTASMEGGGWLLLVTSVFSMCPADLLKAQQYVAVVTPISQDMVSVCVKAVIIRLSVCLLPTAECYIREDRAYLLRLGINPLVRHSYIWTL